MPRYEFMPVQIANFKTSFTDWQDAFDYWREAAALGIVDAWRLQSRYIAERLIGGDALSAKAGGWNRSTPPGSKAQGEGAVQRDVARAVFPLKAEGYYNVKLKRRIEVAVRESDVPGLQKMVSAGLFGSAHVAMKVLPAGNEYTAHQNSRASRGRVTSKTQKFAVPGDTYLKQYIRQEKQAVGNGKGGWAESLLALGGKCPTWILRHRRAGTCVDNLKPGRTELSFSMINRSKWAEGGDEDRIIDTVMADRADFILRDIETLLANGWGRDATGKAVPLSR